SYTSLLALVPLAAIGVAFMSAFPVFDDVRGDLTALIFENVAPHAGQQVQDYFDRFVGNTGRLTTVGVIGLAVTALLLLST
ncbi:MAG: YhjD/YihY/BrkB family envelope integrity protein, partial [Alphaproteobacteria bacterium]